RLAGTEAIDAAKAADIRRSLDARLVDLAKPALPVDVGQRQRGHQRGRDPLLRMDTRVGRLALDLHLPALSPDRATGALPCRLPIDVEAKNRIAQLGEVDETGAPQATLFANGEQERQGWMGDLVLDEGGGQRGEDGHAGAVVPAQGRQGGRNNAIAPLL